MHTGKVLSTVNEATCYGTTLCNFNLWNGENYRWGVSSEFDEDFLIPPFDRQG